VEARYYDRHHQQLNLILGPAVTPANVLNILVGPRIKIKR
jgi:hypothetical protein